MNTLAQATAKQMSAQRLTNNLGLNRIGLGIRLYPRFNTAQARYLLFANGELTLTSSLRETLFTDKRPSGL